VPMKLYDPISEILERKGYEVWSVAPTAPVFEAVLRMSQARVGALLVLERGKLVGIISERDYARKVILEGRSSKETLVWEIMTTPVITVGPTATVDECMQLMTAHRIRHLPVLEDQKAAGMISIGDLVQWIISAHEGMVEQLSNYISGRYPA
jgi:CBS domain-containing protein